MVTSRLRKNIVSGGITNIINTLVLLVAYPFYLKFLGYKLYGLWLTFGIVLSLARATNMGVAQAVSKVVAEELGKNELHRINAYIVVATSIIIMLGLVTVPASIIFNDEIISVFRFSGEIKIYAMTLLPYVTAISIYSLFVQILNSTLAGLGRIDLSNYIETSGKLVLVVLAIVLLYMGLGLYGLLVASLISTIFLHCVYLTYIKRYTSGRLFSLEGIRKTDFSSFRKIVFGLTGGSAVGMLGIPFNKFMLARYAGVESLPVFEIAFRGAIQIRNVYESSLRAFMPEVSRITSSIKVENIMKISAFMRRTMKYILTYGTASYLLIFLLSDKMIKIWLGRNYEASISLTFKIILIATFINLLAVPSYYFLIGMGKVKNVFYGISITWLSNIMFVVWSTIVIGELTPEIAGGCLVLSWTLSSIYLIIRYRTTISHYMKTV